MRVNPDTGYIRICMHSIKYNVTYMYIYIHACYDVQSHVIYAYACDHAYEVRIYMHAIKYNTLHMHMHMHVIMHMRMHDVTRAMLHAQCYMHNVAYTGYMDS